MNHFGGWTVVTVRIVNTLAENGYNVALFVSEPLDQQQLEEFMGERFHASVKVVFGLSYLRRLGQSVWGPCLGDLYVNAIQSAVLKAECDLLIDTYSNCVFPWTDICYIHFPLSSLFPLGFPHIGTASFWALLDLPHVLFERNFLRYEDKLLLANSFFTANAVERYLGAEAQTLYPPVDSSFFNRNVWQMGRTRENLVVTCSRISGGKGLEIIPDIAALTNKNIRFVIVGLAHDRKILDFILRRIEKLGLVGRVSLITDVSRSRLKEVLWSAKVYLHTTREEHFGISIAEAMASGCVPIVHNSGGAKEFVPSKLRYDNYREAAAKIENAVFNWSSKDEEEMSAIAERFSSSNFCKQFLVLFSKYINTGFVTSS
jgi:alpha-1,2-mannosyltransferase